MELIDFIMANSAAFLFVLVRTSSILMAAPIFGAMNVPHRVKAAFSLILALLLTPLAGRVEMPADMASLVVGLGGEILVGAAIGFATRLVFAGIEFAGQIASFQMGLGIANVYDPMQGAQVTVLGRLFSLLTLLVFLSVNGHLIEVMVLQRSFELIPAYGFHMSGAFIENIVAFSREVFVLAVKFSAPIVAVLVFVNIGIGIMARTVPQLNMFVIGFAMTIPVGLIMIGLSMPVMDEAMVAAFDAMWNGVFNLMKVM